MGEGGFAKWIFHLGGLGCHYGNVTKKMAKAEMGKADLDGKMVASDEGETTSITACSAGIRSVGVWTATVPTQRSSGHSTEEESISAARDSPLAGAATQALLMRGGGLVVPSLGAPPVLVLPTCGREHAGSRVSLNIPTTGY